MVTLAKDWPRVHLHDSTAFDRLFTSEYPRVVSIAYRVLYDAHEAEDVAQEVFCSFYHRHDADAGYAPAWLHRAAVHTALNAIRGKKRRRQRETVEALGRERTDDMARASLDPQQALEEAERRNEVRAALARLPQKSASILVLRYSGLSYAEVATALDIRIGQVGTLLKRAETALRKELDNASSR